MKPCPAPSQSSTQGAITKVVGLVGVRRPRRVLWVLKEETLP
jgi:hypothetical protein